MTRHSHPSTPRRPFTLRDLSPLARLGVLATLVVLIGGTASSGAYLYLHHEKRDERPGLTIDDVKGHYHGVVSPSLLLEALRAGHPETLAQADRDALVQWLTGDRVAQLYDDLDLGDNAPAEIIADGCLSCHARNAQGPEAYPKLPLEYWDDIRPHAFSKNIQPISVEILAASTHTHALGLAALTLALMAFAWCSSWPRALVSTLLAITGLGLMIDIGSWWLTRWNDVFAYAIVAGGIAYSTGATLLSLLIVADLLAPRQRSVAHADTE